MNDEEIQTLIERDILAEQHEERVYETPPTPTERRERIFALMGAGVLTLGIIVGGGVVGIEQTHTPAVVAQERVVSVPHMPRKPSTPNPYDALNLQAKAFVVYDVYARKALTAHNAAEPRPLASLTKIMTSLVAVENANLGDHLAISDFALDTEGDSGLLVNETWKLGDLISYTMLTSSNDGADAIAASVGGLFETTPQSASAPERVDSFVSHMNMRARDIGLTHTTYRNATGLDEPGGVDGGSGSAEDMAMLLAYAWEHAPQAMEGTTRLEKTYISEDGFVHDGHNTNEYVTAIPGLLASKTGYTENAGGNLAILYNSGLDHPIAVVVLGSTIDGRFADVQELVKATYRYISSGWYAYEVAGSSERVVH